MQRCRTLQTTIGKDHVPWVDDAGGLVASILTFQWLPHWNSKGFRLWILPLTFSASSLKSWCKCCRGGEAASLLFLIVARKRSSDSIWRQMCQIWRQKLWNDFVSLLACAGSLNAHVEIRMALCRIEPLLNNIALLSTLVMTRPTKFSLTWYHVSLQSV